MTVGKVCAFLHRKWNMFLVNHIYAGTFPKFFERKRRLLNAIGFDIGTGTKVVAPLVCTGKLRVGMNCWIGKNFFVNGNGKVTIGDNCDIAPEVIFETGGHAIGGAERRAGKGEIYTQNVGNGSWIGGRSTICNNATIGNGCIIAACACVVGDVPNGSLVGGVPAKIIRKL